MKTSVSSKHRTSACEAMCERDLDHESEKGKEKRDGSHVK
jgi:hypothetical protein